MTINFIDLAKQQSRIKDKIDAGIADVLAHGQYILGPEVRAFEAELKAFGNAQFAVTCANGTDALLLPLMSWTIPKNAAIFCPSFTYCATAEVVGLRQLTPVFVDIDRETYNMSPESLRAAIEGVIADGVLTPYAVIIVDLFGQCANYPELVPIAREFGLKIISDSAQGFGSTLGGQHPLAWCDVATTSFFPAKPLGCYGDGGAVFTNDPELAKAMESLRMHGMGVDKYDNVRIGLNSRLDSLQAAILRPKLEIFADEIERRNAIAARYSEGLRGYVNRVPRVIDDVISTWAQYTIEVDSPDGLQAQLKEHGIPTARYYPKPIHKQTAYTDFPCGKGGMDHTESAMQHTISLPMHPYLEENTQDFVIDHVKRAVKHA